jgi:hypothetical protein
MVRKAMLAVAISLSLLGVSAARASAQALAIRAVVAVPPIVVAAPPAYLAIGPAPGPGYIWVPAYRRWVFHGYAHPYYRVWGRPLPRVFVRGRVWR